MTGSLFPLVLAYSLAVLCTCSLCDYLRVHIDALIQVVCVVGDIHRTVPQDYIVDAMASENGQAWKVTRAAWQKELDPVSGVLTNVVFSEHDMCPVVGTSWPGFWPECGTRVPVRDIHD